MQILKTVVDHGPMPVVEFHGEGGEEIQVRLTPRPAADDETLIEVAKVMMLHAAAFDPPIEDRAGISEQKSRWEGSSANRPGGYLPANDAPDRDHDAAGETPTSPDKRRLSDAPTTPDTPKER